LLDVIDMAKIMKWYCLWLCGRSPGFGGQTAEDSVFLLLTPFSWEKLQKEVSGSRIGAVVTVCWA
jgi:hypothetical protein